MTSFALEPQTVTTEYNGWTNRETWIVNLWLTNDESYYTDLMAIAKDFDSTCAQAEEIERYVHWLIDTGEPAGLVSDLLSTSLGRVDWYEIAEANQQ